MGTKKITLRNKKTGATRTLVRKKRPTKLVPKKKGTRVKRPKGRRLNMRNLV